MTWPRGAHLVRGGGDLLYNRATIAFPGALQGSYTFTSIANLQRPPQVKYSDLQALAGGDTGVDVVLQGRGRMGLHAYPYSGPGAPLANFSSPAGLHDAFQDDFFPHLGGTIL